MFSYSPSKLRGLVASLFLMLSASACSTVIAPQYAPGSGHSLRGSAQVGSVHYLPHERDGFDANQLDDSTIGNIELTQPVAEFVQHALHSELQAAGVQVHDGAPLAVSIDVEKFEVGSFGFRIEWRARLRIGIIRRADNKLLYDHDFSGELKHGKMTTWELSGFPGAVVAQALRTFLREDEVRRLLASGGRG